MNEFQEYVNKKKIGNAIDRIMDKTIDHANDDYEYHVSDVRLLKLAHAYSYGKYRISHKRSFATYMALDVIHFFSKDFPKMVDAFVDGMKEKDVKELAHCHFFSNDESLAKCSVLLKNKRFFEALSNDRRLELVANLPRKNSVELGINSLDIREFLSVNSRENSQIEDTVEYTSGRSLYKADYLYESLQKAHKNGVAINGFEKCAQSMMQHPWGGLHSFAGMLKDGFFEIDDVCVEHILGVVKKSFFRR